MRLPLRRSTPDPGPRYSHFTLPAGTILTFKSAKGNVFEVELLNGLFEDHSRYVKVHKAPRRYEGTVIMCVVSPRRKVEVMAHAYQAARGSVGVDDIVYLIDLDTGTAQDKVRPFKVKEVRK